MNTSVSLSKAKQIAVSNLWVLRAALFLTLGALGCWVYSLVSMTLVINDYGIINSYGAPYFAAMVLLSAAFLVTVLYARDVGWLALLHLGLLVAILNGTPILLEQTPRFTFVYTGYGYVDYIVRTGHIDQSRFIYHNWPGMQFVLALVQQVSGISGATLLWLGPLVLQAYVLVTAALLYSVFGLDRSTTLLGTWVLVLLSPGAGYLLPGALAMIFLLLTVTMLVRSLTQQSATSDTVGLRLVTVLCLMALVTTHLLTVIIAVVTMMLITGYTWLLRRPIRFNLLVVVVSLIMLWQLFVVEGWTLSTLPVFIQGIFRLDYLVRDTAKLGFGGSDAHTQVIHLRLLYAVMFAAMALLGLVSWCKRRWLAPEIIVPGLGISAALSMALFTSYSGEIVSRAFGYSAMFIALLVALNNDGRYRRMMLGAVLMIAPLAYPIYAFGNERIDYVAPSELRSVDFFYEHVPEQIHMIKKDAHRVWYYRFIEHAYGVDGEPELEYVATGQAYRATIEFVEGETHSEIDAGLARSADQFHKLYTNQQYDLYGRVPGYVLPTTPNNVWNRTPFPE